MKIKMFSNASVYNVEGVGIFTPKKVYVEELRAGEVGFITANIKQVADCNVGDTLTEEKNPCAGHKAIGWRRNMTVPPSGAGRRSAGLFLVQRACCSSPPLRTGIVSIIANGGRSGP
jgi:hypothetical protein